MTARPNRNGVGNAKENPARKNRGRSVRMDAPIIMAGGRTPVGPAPQGSGRNWSIVWNKVVGELPWLDKTHRRYLEETFDLMRQREEVRDFFKHRKAQLVKEGRHPAEAYLTDDGGKRHPMAVQWLLVSTELRKALAALGASPHSQVKLISAAGKAAGNPVSKEDDTGDVMGYFNA